MSLFSFRENFVVLKDYFLFSPGVINMQRIKHGNRDAKKREHENIGDLHVKGSKVESL